MSTPLISVLSNGNPSSSGGTVDESSEQSVVNVVHEAEVHHANNSQILSQTEDSEATITDPEDHLLTPAQRPKSDFVVTTQQTAEDMVTIELEDSQLITDESKRKRNDNTSSEEDVGIVMKFGSFVNSFFYEEKKVKVDKSKEELKTPDDDDMEVVMGGAFNV